ncbi:hypothetical protein OMCYN_00721 [cyanobiont of Ornithocercus magnificus]|nr:hypothetical protein OMCYN_00721 [cyanobiont of Ornithocercus magnificus]
MILTDRQRVTSLPFILIRAPELTIEQRPNHTTIIAFMAKL